MRLMDGSPEVRSYPTFAAAKKIIVTRPSHGVVNRVDLLFFVLGARVCFG